MTLKNGNIFLNLLEIGLNSEVTRNSVILLSKWLLMRPSKNNEIKYEYKVFMINRSYSAIVLTENNKVQSNTKRPHVMTGCCCWICRDNWVSYFQREYEWNSTSNENNVMNMAVFIIKGVIPKASYLSHCSN